MISIRIRTLIMIVMALIGCWQMGEGAYIHAKAQLAQELIEDAWQQTLETLKDTKPWPWADTWPVGRLRVPQHDIDLFVLAGDHGQSLAFGPGHNSNTALPGNTGASFISGHRDTHFSFLQDLQRGEEILFQNKSGLWYRFVVGNEEIVNTNQEMHINQNDNALYLVTCYPFDAIIPGGPLRYVVTASSETSIKL